MKALITTLHLLFSIHKFYNNTSKLFYDNQVFLGLQEVTVCNFFDKTNPDPPTVTFASCEILFLLVSSLSHPGSKKEILG